VRLLADIAVAQGGDQPRFSERHERGPVMPTNTVQLLTVVDAARHLRISRSKVYELLASGELPSVRIGRNRRITMADLADFVENHLERSTPAPIE
jgi:excisionase family DNA binding protein